MANKLTITDEELAKIITVAVFGYVTGVNGEHMTDEEVKQLYEATLTGINEEIPDSLPFTEEFIRLYDDITELRKSAEEIYEEKL